MLYEVITGLSCCSLLPCLEGLVVNSNKFVDEGLNITEVDPGVALTPGQILFVSVNGFEVDYQDDARITSYNVCYTKLLRSLY